MRTPPSRGLMRGRACVSRGGEAYPATWRCRALQGMGGVYAPPRVLHARTFVEDRDQARVADGHIPRLSGIAIPPHRGFSLLPCAAGRWGARIAPHRLGGAGSPDQVQTGVATPLMNAGGESGGVWPSVAFGTAHIAGHSDEPTEGSVSLREVTPFS